MFVQSINGYVEINEKVQVLGRPEPLLIYKSSRELGIR